jgi:magnesium chelatase subunit H
MILGISRLHSTSALTNASGSYSSNVNLSIENGTWENEAELQEMYLRRKSFVLSADNPGTMGQNRTIFETALQTADITFQTKVSTTVQHNPHSTLSPKARLRQRKSSMKKA